MLKYMWHFRHSTSPLRPRVHNSTLYDYSHRILPYQLYDYPQLIRDVTEHGVIELLYGSNFCRSAAQVGVSSYDRGVLYIG